MTAYFLTRVELHGATAQDYVALHIAMARQGFQRQITGDDKVTYLLPTGEYVMLGDALPSVIRDKAAIAARQVGKPFAIVVGNAINVAWVGLAKA